MILTYCTPRPYTSSSFDLYSSRVNLMEHPSGTLLGALGLYLYIYAISNLTDSTQGPYTTVTATVSEPVISTPNL